MPCSAFSRKKVSPSTRWAWWPMSQLRLVWPTRKPPWWANPARNAAITPSSRRTVANSARPAVRSAPAADLFPTVATLTCGFDGLAVEHVGVHPAGRGAAGCFQCQRPAVGTHLNLFGTRAERGGDLIALSPQNHPAVAHGAAVIARIDGDQRCLTVGQLECVTDAEHADDGGIDLGVIQFQSRFINVFAFADGQRAVRCGKLG